MGSSARNHVVCFRPCYGFPSVDETLQDMLFDIPEVMPNVKARSRNYGKFGKDLNEIFGDVKYVDTGLGSMGDNMDKPMGWEFGIDDGFSSTTRDDDQGLLPLVNDLHLSVENEIEKVERSQGLEHDAGDLENDESLGLPALETELKIRRNLSIIRNKIGYANSSEQRSVACRDTNLETNLPKWRKNNEANEDMKDLRQKVDCLQKSNYEFCAGKPCTPIGGNGDLKSSLDSDTNPTKTDGNGSEECLKVDVTPISKQVRFSYDNHANNISKETEEANNLSNSHQPKRIRKRDADRTKSLSPCTVSLGDENSNSPNFHKKRNTKRKHHGDIQSTTNSKIVSELNRLQKKSSNGNWTSDNKNDVDFSSCKYAHMNVNESRGRYSLSGSRSSRLWSKIREYSQNMLVTPETNAGGIQGSELHYNFDGEFEDPAPIGDLSTFDFDHMTKQAVDLEPIQEQYIALSRREGILPVGHILRHLPSNNLRLQALSLGQKRIKILCATLLSHEDILLLEISEDVINLQSMVDIIDAIKEQWVIEHLLLQDNNMGRGPVKILMDFLMSSDQLTSLTLGGNCLDDADGVMVAEYITITQNLTVLDLSHNRLGLQSADSLSKALIKNASIHTLSISWNHMSGRATNVFIACLLKNKAIVNLDLSWNSIEEASADTLNKALKSNNTLSLLDISSCRLREYELRVIFESLKKNQSVKNILIGNNLFSCQEVYDILLEFSKFKGQVTVKEIDFIDMPMLASVKDVTTTLVDDKDLIISHGPLIGRREGKETDEDILATLNPSTILSEFAKLLGMTLTELFELLDQDGDRTLSRDEIKQGLLMFNIPLPERSLDLILRQMDRDGDGVISLVELLGSNNMTARSYISDVLYSREKDKTRKDGGSRYMKILKRMMAQKPGSEVVTIKRLTLAEKEEERLNREEERRSRLAEEEFLKMIPDGNENQSAMASLSNGVGQMVKLPSIHKTQHGGKNKNFHRNTSNNNSNF